MQRSSARTLYLCYFSLREPLVQTQVLPYLRELSRSGIKVCLLTFESTPVGLWSPDEINSSRARLESDGIRWFSLPYHKRPSMPATAYDIVAGARFALRLARHEGINVLHARAHVSMAMALLAQRLGASCRLIFDIRGLMAEEYADAGIWTESSLPFRMVKKLEQVGIRRADQIIVLTRKFAHWLVEHRLKRRDQIEVIPCCVDFSRSAETEKDDAKFRAGRFELIYAGSVTGLYLLEEMGRFFLALQKLRPDAYFRVLTISSPTDVAQVLQRVGLSSDDFRVAAVPPSEVFHYLRRAHLGISFRKPTFSQIAASPTKIPEYLAAGLPVISNAGIGDADELLTREMVGVVLNGFDEKSYKEAVDSALTLADDPQTRARCERIAREHFDLAEVGGIGYRNVYQRIGEETIDQAN